LTTGHRLPEDWLPSAEQQDYARQQGVADVSRMAEDFLDYWLSKAGKDARKTDWNRTWKTWARREGDKCREKAAREARFAKPSRNYVNNADAAHVRMRESLFGEDNGTSHEEPEFSRWN
jgi:hypothetical protein